MLDNLATWIANNLYNSLSDEQKKEYEEKKKGQKNLLIRVKFLMILILLIIFLVPIGYILSIEKELFIGSIVFFFMRYWNNGHHFKTTDKCFVVTISAVLLIPITVHFLGQHILILSILSFISILIFAPFRKQDTRKKFYFKKVVSLIVCVVGYFLGSIVVAAIFIQSIDLIHNIKNKRAGN